MAVNKTDTTLLSRNQHFSDKADNKYPYHIVVSALKEKNKREERVGKEEGNKRLFQEGET